LGATKLEIGGYSPSIARETVPRFITEIHNVLPAAAEFGLLESQIFLNLRPRSPERKSALKLHQSGLILYV